MKKTVIAPLKAGVLSCILLASFSCQHIVTQTSSIDVETGVSSSLATHRRQVLDQLKYDLSLNIPEQREAPIESNESITFNLLEKQQPLQIDFKEQRDHLKQVKVNGKIIPITFEKEHIVIDQKHLKEGQNKIEISFTAGDLSLNRNDDYLYTLLVPDRARTVFPVFDQPDLKATFKLSLTIPKNWKALANAQLQDIVARGDQKTYRFQESDTISTYLFSFVAGDFDLVTRKVNGRLMNFYHRETDSSKINLSLDPIFKIHGDALAFMEDYTQVPYPFQKFDFVAIPDFQYGGMEHVGAIDYKASSLFLDEGATKDQKVSRSNLIAHETAHMWFGDMVTMRWFNDVWMKEVFANFMADKITQVSLEDSNYDLKFLIDHFPAAYAVDRTAGANPIRQPLDNLQDAGTLYGGIIYHKAPVVMRQLERLMGEEAFKKGIREYIQKYANSNASWPDLIEILDRYTPADLQKWNEIWVDEPGRPQFSFVMDALNNKISELTLFQKGEDGSERVWPQLFEVAIVYPDRVVEFTVNMDKSSVSLDKAVGMQEPLFILFNSSGQGYGQFPFDAKMLTKLYMLKDPVMRASAYINLYESMLNEKDITPAQLLSFYRSGLSKEQEELNLKLMTSQLGDIYWNFTSPATRQQIVPGLEQDIWQAMQNATAPNYKKLLFKAYQNISQTEQAKERLYQVWQQQQAPQGVKLTEDDYTSLALALALREYPQGNSILQDQLKRITNPDRRKRLEFMIPALSADEQVRDAFFASLKDPKNREKEAWVASALAYLHHPLRANTSEKYLKESLELLEEIQLTGDIFFPANWLNSTFGAYQTPAAATVVRSFLQQNPDYNQKLKAKILQASDNLFRAEQLLQKEQ
ncbi:M1 family metallopeptidase [Pontibacter sp. MBLB2868]|uniref:M1 family metallopeptidase n=1 Tax=Pontibacter sp. MBLB2868 TaxID=3451555 RepID=UPI003F7502B1